MHYRSAITILCLLIPLTSGCKKNEDALLGGVATKPTTEPALRVIDRSELNERNGVFYAINEDIGFSGIAIRKYQSGQNQEKLNFQNGVQHGQAERWYENGQIEVRYNYENGMLDGIMEEFHADGHLKSTSPYSLGKLDGKAEEFYTEGSLKAVSLYTQGELKSRRFYSPSGSEIPSSPKDIVGGKSLFFVAPDRRVWNVYFYANEKVEVYSDGVRFPIYKGKWSPLNLTHIEIHFDHGQIHKSRIGLNEEGGYEISTLIVSISDSVYFYKGKQLR